MKNLIRVSLALVLIGTSTALRAQTAEVSGGSMAITLDPTLYAALETHGIITTLGPSAGNVTHSDTILSGLFDMPTGHGEFATKGQMKFTGPDGEVVTVLQLGLDTTGAIPAIYGYVYADGVYVKREPIFYITAARGMDSQLKYGTTNCGMLMTLSPYFQSLLGVSFHTSALVGYKGYSILKTTLDLEKPQ